MTIKRKWIDWRGREHEKVLKPGHKERIELVVDDAEGKGYFTHHKGTVHIVSGDELVFKAKMTLGPEGFECRTPREMTFRQELINYEFTSRFERNEVYKGRQKVSFNWEPTLPPASRK